MKALRLTGLAAAMSLLAACAVQPPRASAPVSVAIAAPVAPAPVSAPLPAAAPPPDVWNRLRADFALDDCADPRAQVWAKRFTRNPQQLAGQFEQALPLIAWVQDEASNAGVAGELVLLPMVESGYNPSEPGRRGDPAGMWQIMPATARTIGLRIGREYDGRLDPAASTRAVMTMLKGYNDELHDWRLVDMAYNAGEYKISGLMESRPGDVNLKHFPVSSITRDHLAKLMALACIVRDPARFDVELPKSGAAETLTLLSLPRAVELTDAARVAGLSATRLRTLNPGYRSAHMPADAPHHLLLPQENAQRLSAALDSQGVAAIASAKTIGEPKNDTSRATVASASDQTHASRHRVTRGESLWSIARRYKVDPASLRAWNALASDNLRPGQSLLLSAPD